jgi:hypothetical protein
MDALPPRRQYVKAQSRIQSEKQIPVGTRYAVRQDNRATKRGVLMLG